MNRSAMKIAYFTNKYGSPTYTFITSEIEELRALGHDVPTYSVRPVDVAEQALSDSRMRAEQAGTTYFFSGRPFPLAWAVLIAFIGFLIRNPSGLLGALLLSWTTAAPGLAGRARNLGYLLMAALLGRHLLRDQVRHLHNHIGTSSATIAMLASKLTGVPYSLTIHGPHIFFDPQRWALGEKIARSAFTACISDYCKSQCMLFSDRSAWPKLNLIRCTPGRAYLDADPPPLPDAPDLVCVGRLAAEKGHLVLLEAARNLANEGVNFHLTLVGDGPMRAEIETAFAEAGIADRLTITGLLGAPAVADEIRKARLLVQPSFAEGLPVSIMEAYCLGRPVIASDIAAIGELVQPGETGWLVPPGSVEMLQAAIRESLALPVSRLAGMGRDGAKRVRARHDAISQARKLEAAILRSSSDANPMDEGAD